MGLWQWFFDNLVAGRSTVDRQRAASTSSPGAVSGVTATLDAPASAVDGHADCTGSAPWWVPEGEARTIPLVLTRPELTPEAEALDRILFAHLDGHELHLPPLPAVAERVIQKLGNVNYDAAEIAREIEEDPVIAGAVIRMANSALYGGVRQINALLPAVNRLGANAVRTLMLHQALRAATFRRQGGDDQLADIVWKRSLAAACIMRYLAPCAGFDGEEMFVIGLLHDIGCVVVQRETQRHQKALHYDLDLHAFDYLCQEYHQEFGELVAAQWGLPDALRSLVASHHNAPVPDDPLRRERLLLQLTSMINGMVGYGTPATYRLLETAPVQSLGLADDRKFADRLAELPGLIELHVASLAF